MTKDKNQILEALAASVLEMDDERSKSLSHEALDAKIDPKEAITEGLAKGMEAAGVKYEEEEYFVPELLLCSDAMYSGLDILKPFMPKVEGTNLGRVVIGVVEGDTHDIGKNLVKLFLDTHGFKVFDLGRDVPAEKFVEAVKEHQAQFVCMSTLMTTTMSEMQLVIDLLKKEGLREKVKVIIGGSPVSRAFSDKIGADSYSGKAPEAPVTIKEIANK